MKKNVFSFVVFLLIACTAQSQAPQAFNYQAIVRDASGNIIADKEISIRISLLEDSESGYCVYRELHNISTNHFGLVNILIGKGKPEAGEFLAVDWSRGNYYLNIEMDTEKTGNFRKMGITRLLSVPFALYAQQSGSDATRAGEWTNDGTHIFTDEGNFPNANVGIGTSIPGGKLDVHGPGFTSPNAPMLLINHENGFSSTFRRNFEGLGNALFLLQKSRGIMEAPTAVQDGDYIGQIRMEGYDGANYKTAGWLRVKVDGTVTPNVVPGAFLFATTSNAGAVTERMRISSNGNVGIGTTNPQDKLHVYNGIAKFDLPNGQINISTPGGWPGIIAFEPINWHRRDITIDTYGIRFTADDTSDPPANENTVVVAPTGNMGVGTIFPSAKLDVNGSINMAVGSTLMSNGVTLIHNKGDENIFAGGETGLNITTGAYNSAFGFQALKNETIGSKSTAFGYKALYTQTGHAGDVNNTNTAVGYKALYTNNPTESYNARDNVAVGYQALWQNTVGSYNTALGASSLEANTTGIDNTAVGRWSLRSNTTGYRNTAIGVSAMYNMEDGAYNTAIGQGALDKMTSGDSNTVVGYAAGYLAQGNSNVFIGYKAGYNETGSDKLYIDNSDTSKPLIHGDFGLDSLAVNGTLTIKKYRNHSAPNLHVQNDWDNQSYLFNGVYGIFSSAYSETTDNKIAIMGNSRGSTGMSVAIYGMTEDMGSNHDSCWAGYFRYKIWSNKMVLGGTGMKSPSYETQLHIRNTTDNNYGVLVNAFETSGSEIGLHTANSKYASLTKNAYYNLPNWYRFDESVGASSIETTPEGKINFKVTGAASNPIAWTQALTISNSGNIGIMTDVPGSRLEVNGQVKITGGSPGNGKVLTSDANGLASWQTPSTVSPGGTNTNIQYNSSGSFAGTNNLVWDNSNGRVGIGTSSPSYSLDIINTTDNMCLHLLGTGVAGSGARFAFGDASFVYLEEDYDDFLLIHAYGGTRFTGGNVGIGSTNPYSKLEVDGNISAKENAFTIDLLNKSGVNLYPGDVVVTNTSNDLAVEKSAYQDTDVIGVVVLGNPNNSTVKVAVAGIFDVKVNGATARGDYLEPSSTAGVASPTGTANKYCFAIALTSTAGSGSVKATFIKSELY